MQMSKFNTLLLQRLANFMTRGGGGVNKYKLHNNKYGNDY